MRLEIEVCKWMEAREIVLGVGCLSKEWRKAAGSDEVWAPLVTRYFPLHGYAAGGMTRFRELSEGMYLPVLHREDLYRVFFSGKVEVTSLRQPHNWWAGSLSLTIAVLPTSDLFLQLPDSPTCLLLSPLTSLQTPLPDLQIPRLQPGICPTSTSVYLFGGSEVDIGFFNPMSTCEKLDFPAKTWTFLPELREPRASNGALYRNCIYLPSKDMIEVLDTATDTFKTPISIIGMAENTCFISKNRLIIPNKDNFMVLSSIETGNLTVKTYKTSLIGGKYCQNWVCLDSFLVGYSTYGEMRVWKGRIGEAGEAEVKEIEDTQRETESQADR